MCLSSVLICLIFAPSAVFAQQQGEVDPPFRPSNEQLDEELDRSLEQEFADPEEAPPVTPPAPAGDPDVGPDPEDDLRLRLGGFAAHYYSVLDDVELSYREGNRGGDPIAVTEDAAVADFEPEHTQTYRAWIDLGRHVSLAGGFRRGVFRDAREITQGFTFGRTSYAAGELLKTKVDVMTADLDLVLKPLNNRWVELGIAVGTRYMFWRTEMQGEGFRRETSTIEAAVPVVGAHLAFRPAPIMEIFARGRVGYLEYDRPESTHVSNGDFHHVEAKRKEARTAEIDVGVSFLFAETIGVIAGYRIDYIKMERETDDRSEGVEGTVHGLYAGLILQF